MIILYILYLILINIKIKTKIYYLFTPMTKNIEYILNFCNESNVLSNYSYCLKIEKFLKLYENENNLNNISDIIYMNNLNNFTLKFGKYKSKKLYEIYNENPRYLDWISKTFDKENLVN